LIAMVDPLLLAEGEGVCLDAGRQEFDAEGAVVDCSLLANELVEAVFFDGAVAFGVGVHSMICSGGFAVYGDAEADGFTVGGWA